MKLEDFVKMKPICDKNLIFAKLWGSRSHNCHNDSSDYDFSGVYVEPLTAVLSIEGITETLEKTDAPDKGISPDYAFHEVGKFCKLLCKGNPGIVEMLFTERECIETPSWVELKRNSSKFLSKQTVSQYLGYADGQLKRLAKGSYLHTSGGEPGEKWLYHVHRLLNDAYRISCGQSPLVWKDGEERLFLMRIRRGSIKIDEGVKFAHEVIQRVKKEINVSTIREEADIEWLNGWLYNVRMQGSK